jgi:predicted pyridoxine 5'-phosphate oxidase superfamily flavin-nucleotide-binding protein
MRREVTSVEDLRAIVGHPVATVANKVKTKLSEAQQDWLSHSPLGFVATTDVEGRLDVSPKGDPPGFVHVIDDVTLFLIPGRGDTLRINGTARVLADADYFDALVVDGKRPILALEIAVEEVFFHCAKAFLRSDAWKPESWDPTAVPGMARLARAMKPDMTDEQLEDYYSEDNLRKILY